MVIKPATKIAQFRGDYHYVSFTINCFANVPKHFNVKDLAQSAKQRLSPLVKSFSLKSSTGIVTLHPDQLKIVKKPAGFLSFDL